MRFEFFRYELLSWLKSYTPYVFFAVNFLLIFLAVTSHKLIIYENVLNLNLNAPYTIMFYTAIMSLLSIVMTTAFMNMTVLKDHKHNFSPILFSAPIRKGAYLFGKFSSALIVSMIPLIAVFAALFLASIFPMGNEARVGPIYFGAYLNSFLLFVVPNTIIIGSLIFALASLFRSTVASFLAAMGLLVAYLMIGNLITNINNHDIAILADPLGIHSLSILTKYWTVADKNSMYLSLNSGLLINRLIWLVISGIVLALTYFKFSFTEKKEKTSKKKMTLSPSSKSSFSSYINLPKVKINDQFSAKLSQFWIIFKSELLGAVKNIPFVLLLAFTMFNLLSRFSAAGNFYGYPNHPVTFIMLEAISMSTYIFITALIAYYSAVIVWRERNAKINEIIDASPYPTWIPFTAKIVSLVSIVAIFLFSAMILAICTQALSGHFNFEIALYVKQLFLIDLSQFFILIAVSFAIHLVVNNFYLGIFLFIVFNVVNNFVWSGFGIDSNLLIVGGTPQFNYSDLSQFTPNVLGLTSYKFYWLLFSLIALTLASLFSLRGMNSSWSDRLKIATQNANKNYLMGLGSLAFLWLLTGSFLFYNAEIINDSQTEIELNEVAAEYEKNYSKYKEIPQPRVVAIDYAMDLYPEKRSFESTFKIWLKNNHLESIDSIHFSSPSEFSFLINVPNSEKLLDDERLGYSIFALAQPMENGDSIEITVNCEYFPKGIENSITIPQLTQNGIFLNNRLLVPAVGYNTDMELVDNSDREIFSLEKRERMQEVGHNCTSACSNNYISQDSDWISLNGTVSTSSDQIAIAPGSLVKEWEDNGRRYFNYQLDEPTLNWFTILSARYEVRRESWEGIELEIYYHKGHEYNVERMLLAMKESIQYYSENFSDYPHEQARIIEFPRFAHFAQAFAGTMPYSESAGFLSDLGEEEDIDRVFYVIAHELAHQWWGNQVVGANVQGATMLSESFAQYSALMVMEKVYGREKMKRFMEYEMHSYLKARSGETAKEMPLMQVEDQGYIHYRKGSVAMYAMREYIGEEKMNAVLSKFANEYSFAEAPFPTAVNYMKELENVVPDSLRYLSDDFFKKIVLYDNSISEASYSTSANGTHEITVQFDTKKFEADEKGVENVVELNDFIQVAIYGEENKLLHREMILFTTTRTELKFQLNEIPREVQIDPSSLLIDRFLDNNVKSVSTSL